MAFDPTQLRTAITSPRWTALTRSGLDLTGVMTWDPGLLRETRVLVPADIQAMYVPAGSTETMVTLPFALTEPDGQPAKSMPAPFDPGAPRPGGVHLHVAMPDALLRGTLQTRPDGSTNRLGLAALPDRWLVLRLLVPNGATAVTARGWVICADIGTVVDLAAWKGEQALPAAKRHIVAPSELTGSVGGSAQWASTYDAAIDRFAFHDPLDDLATIAPNGVVGDQASYLVSGWWSHPGLDPLDAARTDASLHDHLDQLGWHLQDDLEGGHLVGIARTVQSISRSTLELSTAERYDVSGPARAAPRSEAGLLGPGVLLRQAVEPTTRYQSQLTPFSDVARRIVSTEPSFPRSTLIHGAVFGVPTGGPVDPRLENRPAESDLSVALGHQGDDIAATVATDGFGVTDPDDRRAAERLIGGFTGQILDRLATPDGLVEIEEHEHDAGFTGLPGGTSGTDRVKMGDASAPLTAGAAGRSTRSREAQAAAQPLEARVTWAGRTRFELREDDGVSLRRQVLEWTAARPVTEPSTEVREIAKPAPRWGVPSPPILAVRGARRSLRHRGDGRFSLDGLLRVRWPSQILRAPALVDLSSVMPTVGSSAVPDEALALAHEAVLMNPYLSPWLSTIAAKSQGVDPGVMRTRFQAESVLRYGRAATFDGRSAFMATQLDPSSLSGVLVADQLRRHSLFEGVEPDPVAITAWSQPWVPLWLEWEAELTETDPLEHWTLGQVDLEPPDQTTAGRVLTHQGRSILTTGVATTMAAAITGWLAAEEARDAAGQGEVDAATSAGLATLRDRLDSLDVMSAALDGLREQLLGLPYQDGLAARPQPGADPPELLVRGELRISKARLLDAFGRAVQLTGAPTPGLPARDEITTPKPALRIRPRLNVPARWLLRLVDPAGPAFDAAEARVDQVDPTQTVNPVAGFLLPDHIDDALEVFDVAGAPLGQLMHEAFGGGIVWEPAPGRPLPEDAGPLEGLGPPQLLIGHLAAGLVAEDSAQRGGLPARPETESALSALLRAIDTTLWSVDTYGALGSEHIAGLVGRPVAVVRATLSLEVKSDLDDLDLSDPHRRAVREQAYRDLAALAFSVRLGELTRTDDGLLGFFVDDNYSRFHIVDNVVASHAFDSGPGRGQLGTYGTTPAIPDPTPITNPYIVPGDELFIHPGQSVTLTLLMYAGGRTYLTSGILPRVSVQLQRDWVAPGLAVIAPSARIGAVLIDPAKVSLPLISVFPKDQLFTRRDSPITWKDDPILAATQTALLPDLPHEVQEGYIRIAPAPASKGTVGGSS
jgi:hypothetical protein